MLHWQSFQQLHRPEVHPIGCLLAHFLGPALKRGAIQASCLHGTAPHVLPVVHHEDFHGRFRSVLIPEVDWAPRPSGDFVHVVYVRRELSTWLLYHPHDRVPAITYPRLPHPDSLFSLSARNAPPFLSKDVPKALSSSDVPVLFGSCSCTPAEHPTPPAPVVVRRQPAIAVGYFPPPQRCRGRSGSLPTVHPSLHLTHLPLCRIQQPDDACLGGPCWQFFVRAQPGREGGARRAAPAFLRVCAALQQSGGACPPVLQ